MARPKSWTGTFLFTCYCGRLFVLEKGEAVTVGLLKYEHPTTPAYQCVTHVVGPAPEPEHWAPWMAGLASNA